MPDNIIRFGKALNAPEEYFKNQIGEFKTLL